MSSNGTPLFLTIRGFIIQGKTILLRGDINASLDLPYNTVLNINKQNHITKKSRNLHCKSSQLLN